MNRKFIFVNQLLFRFIRQGRKRQPDGTNQSLCTDDESKLLIQPSWCWVHGYEIAAGKWRFSDALILGPQHGDKTLAPGPRACVSHPQECIDRKTRLKFCFIRDKPEHRKHIGWRVCETSEFVNIYSKSCWKNVTRLVLLGIFFTVYTLWWFGRLLKLQNTGNVKIYKSLYTKCL